MAYFYESKNGHFKKLGFTWENAKLYYFAKYDVFCGYNFLGAVKWDCEEKRAGV